MINQFWLCRYESTHRCITIIDINSWISQLRAFVLLAIVFIRSVTARKVDSRAHLVCLCAHLRALLPTDCGRTDSFHRQDGVVGYDHTTHSLNKDFLKWYVAPYFTFSPWFCNYFLSSELNGCGCSTLYRLLDSCQITDRTNLPGLWQNGQVSNEIL